MKGRRLIYAVVKALAGLGIAGLAVRFMVGRVVEGQGHLDFTCWTQKPLFFLMSIVATLLVFGMFALSWICILKYLNAHVPSRRAALIWFISNAGKYIPGKIFMYIGRVGLLCRDGVSPQCALVAVVLEVLLMTAAAVPFCFSAVALFFPEQLVWFWSCSVGFGGVLLLLICWPGVFSDLLCRFFTKRTSDLYVAARGGRGHKYLLGAFGCGVAAWMMFGLSGWFLCLSCGADIALDLTSSIFVASWMLGFFSFFVPSGIGVREGVQLLLLGNFMEIGSACSISVLGRLVWSVVEMLFIAFSVFFFRKSAQAGAVRILY